MTFTEIIFILTLLLPQEQPFQHESINGPSFGSEVGHIKGSSGKHFVYRFDKSKDLRFFFWDSSISQIAADLKLAPQLIAKDDFNQCMILEYVEQKEWPSYEEDPRPYHECMRLLHKFHTSVKELIEPILNECPHSSFYPFIEIENISLNFQKEKIPVPRHFFQVSELISVIFKKLQPWLKKNGIICHNDFHIHNCLLAKDRTYIIDWATVAPFCDPFHDIASFACILKKDQRKELLKSYLGTLTISPEDYAHYRLLEFVSLARIAALCLYDQRKTLLPNDKEKEIITNNMETLLDSKVLSGLSFTSVSYALDAAQLRMRALLALQEFLDESHEISLLLECL